MPDALPISTEAKLHLQRAILQHEGSKALRTNYCMQLVPYPPNALLPIPRKQITTDVPTLLAFADDAPLFNWAHPCRYLLFRQDNQQFHREIKAEFPPFAGKHPGKQTFECFHKPVQHAQVQYTPVTSQPVVRPRSSGKRYAVLISGMSNYRHLNDLEFIYRTLIQQYRYDPLHIFVHHYDGTLNYDGNPRPVLDSWPGDDTPYKLIINSQGSKSAVLAQLDDLKTKLTAADSLLIHTSNHGGHSTTESDLCCYPNFELNDALTVTEFTDKLEKLPAIRNLMVMMEQCHSGGFHAKVIAKSTAAKTSIASACGEMLTSMGGEKFNPFARCWISAMACQDPSGIMINADGDMDSKISSQEAFDYALTNKVPEDSPVFDQVGAGGKEPLGAPMLRWPGELPGIEPMIRELWPTDDQRIEKQLVRLLPALKKMEQSWQKTTDTLRQKYMQQLKKMIKH